MLALSPRVVDAVWAAVSALLPAHRAPQHPLGCHRPRIPDRTCFEGLLIRLVTGCSWDVAGRLSHASETTLRRRRDEWLVAGVFGALAEEALGAYDRIVGFRLEDLAVDASQHKAPAGGQDTGPSCTDRGKRGWKWSIAAGHDGIPVGWCVGPANRNDCKLLEATLDAVAARGLLCDAEVVHLDRGYDSTSCAAPAGTAAWAMRSPPPAITAVAEPAPNATCRSGCAGPSSAPTPG